MYTIKWPVRYKTPAKEPEPAQPEIDKADWEAFERIVMRYNLCVIAPPERRTCR